MALLRALVASAAAATVKGLSVGGAPGGPAAANLLENLAASKAGTTTALDPELTNTAGEKFHITQAGEWFMVGVPEAASLDEPAKAQILVTANFSKMTKAACEDLLIRSITIQGFVLGRNATKLKLSVNNDTFNSTAALGLTLTQVKNGTETEKKDLTPEQFTQYLPHCLISRPKGNGTLKAPTKNSFRRRTKFYVMECLFSASVGTKATDFVTNKLIIWWSTVWRGIDDSSNKTTYYNDISFSLGDVGKKPVGLLGTDNHDDATKVPTGCAKPQPVLGPFQKRQGPKEKPWVRRRHEKAAAAAKMAAHQQ